MNRLLTAVGHLHIERRNKDGKIPVVILKNREYILDIQEFVVWSSLNWRILRPDQIRELYQKKELETGFYSSRSFDGLHMQADSARPCCRGLWRYGGAGIISSAV